MLKRDELVNPKSCLNKAMDDEYLFVLLQRDPAAQAAIMAWVNRRLALGLNQPSDKQIIEAIQTANDMGYIDKPTGPGWWYVKDPNTPGGGFYTLLIPHETLGSAIGSGVTDGKLLAKLAGHGGLADVDGKAFVGCKWSKR